jgi:hypothetical protein
LRTSTSDGRRLARLMLFGCRSRTWPSSLCEVESSRPPANDPAAARRSSLLRPGRRRLCTSIYSEIPMLLSAGCTMTYSCRVKSQTPQTLSLSSIPVPLSALGRNVYFLTSPGSRHLAHQQKPTHKAGCSSNQATKQTHAHVALYSVTVSARFGLLSVTWVFPHFRVSLFAGFDG